MYPIENETPYIIIRLLKINEKEETIVHGITVS